LQPTISKVSRNAPNQGCEGSRIYQDASSHVPGLEAKFPVGVNNAKRNVTAIYCSSTQSPDTLVDPHEWKERTMSHKMKACIEAFFFRNQSIVDIIA